eukprot:9333984-Alexandrium_andersonii.AAC.1
MQLVTHCIGAPSGALRLGRRAPCLALKHGASCSLQSGCAALQPLHTGVASADRCAACRSSNWLRREGTF